LRENALEFNAQNAMLRRESMQAAGKEL